MFDIFDQYATDENAEVSGAWFPLGPKDQDGRQPRLLIGRSGNSEFNKMFASEVDKHQAEMAVNAEGVGLQIAIEVLAKTILLGWENITYKRKPIEYSHANAKMLLAHRDFREQVERFAREREAFKAKLEDEQGKT